MSLFRVAAQQLTIPRHDPATARIAVLDAARAARTASADLVVFPELVLTGPIDDAHHLVVPEADVIALWRNVARDAGIDVITGSAILRANDRETNTTFYIDARGEVRGRHDKSNLWRSERTTRSPGSTVTVVGAGFARVGLGICWDITDATFCAALARAGADVLAFPAYWAQQIDGPEVRHSHDAERLHIDALCVTRAFENSAAVVFANAAGPDYPIDPQLPKRLAGNSQICVPFRGAIARAETDDMLVIADIDTALLDDAQELYGTGTRELTQRL